MSDRQFSSDFFDSALESYFSELQGEERLLSAMRYSVLNGGKRLRARLLLSSADLFGFPIEKAMLAAIAIELVHTYSLIHDDLPALDNDDRRRGKPTLHIAFDEATAILAGNALLGEAFRLLTLPRLHPSSAIRETLVNDLAQAIGPAGLLGGQMLDLAAEGRFTGLIPEQTVDSIRLIQLGKTGALFRFSCLAGARLAEAEVADQNNLKNYADHLGFAFQIKDDLLDELGSHEKTGKRVGKDADMNKPTLVKLLGHHQADIILQQQTNGALACLAGYGERAEPLANLARFNAIRDH